MNKCIICQRYIYDHHGNSKYCKDHKPKGPHKFTPVPRVQKVTMDYDDFIKLKADSDELKRIKGER